MLRGVATADKDVYLSFVEYQADVTQKLANAQNKNADTVLQEIEAFEKRAKYVDTNGVTRLRYALEEIFPLKLQTLQVVDKMQDKSYDLTIRPKAGWYGSVPWPPENERPEALRNARLWYPRTPPEYYREKDPELYAFYKPLFEENRKNTEKHTRETRIREVRRGLLNSIKWYLEIECDRGAESRDFGSYLRLVDEIIEDKQLRDEILSDIPPERRLPVSPSEEKTAP
jgi:predicted DCC family thiol-disulfide oxidoreductase YuxK